MIEGKTKKANKFAGYLICLAMGALITVFVMKKSPDWNEEARLIWACVTAEGL